MALFLEEKKLMEDLVDEWYAAIDGVTKKADTIFSEKGRMYDVKDPVWARVEWPNGFVHELTKKANRVKQLMSDATEVSGLNVSRIHEANEELRDILNYSRMLHALNDMLMIRWEVTREQKADWPARSQIKPGETRVTGSDNDWKNPLHGREGETEAEYRQRLDRTFAADGSLRDGAVIPVPDTKTWEEPF